MPVKGITPKLIELGKIKIGIKGAEITSKGGTTFRPPQKLNHFVIVTTEKDGTGDFIPDTDLMDYLKKRPKAAVDDAGNLVGIPVKLLYNDPDKNFPTRYAAYKGARLICQGDGEKGYEDGVEKKCPCHRLGVNCKINGVLTVLVDGQDTLGGCHKFRTTSINTVSSILGSLQLLHIATGGNVAFVPLEMVVKPKSTVLENGTQVLIYIVSLVFRGDVKKLQEIAFKTVQEKSQFAGLLTSVADAHDAPSPLPETDEEAREIVEEFYHDARAKATAVEEASVDSPVVVVPDEVALADEPSDEIRIPVERDETKGQESIEVPEPAPESVAAPEPEKKPAKTKKTVEEPAKAKVEPPASAPTPASVTAPAPQFDLSGPITPEQQVRIKKCKDQMGLDKDAWYAYVLRLTGKKSALELNQVEAANFITHLEEEDVPF